MNPTQEIVYVNSINENIMQRLAGCDFDSDTVLLTDNEILIRAAKRTTDMFKVAVYNVSGTKKARHWLESDMADLDIKTSKNLIGNVINLSQCCNTLIWHSIANGGSYEDIQDIYHDVCKLSIASNIEIDCSLGVQECA